VLLQRLLGLRDLRFLVGQGAMVSQAQLSVLAMARLAVRCGHVCVRLVCVCVCLRGLYRREVVSLCVWMLSCAIGAICLWCPPGAQSPPEKSRVAASSRTLPLLCLCQPV
jgi:hypothetical protein